MKRIGFVDYYLDEWHACHYPALIAEQSKALGGDAYAVAYAWAELDASPKSGVTTEEWCRERDIEAVGSLGELCERSDVIVILAPDDPDRHLDYVKEVFPYGKPTFIDKTYAPDAVTAREIERLSSQYGTPYYSTSALRFCPALDPLRRSKTGADTAVIYGQKDITNYAVHLFELMNTVMKGGACRIKAIQGGRNRVAVVDYGEGRQAVYCQIDAKGAVFAVSAERDGENVYIPVQSGPSFDVAIREMLLFFRDGTLPVDPADTYEIMCLTDALRQALTKLDTWIDIAY